MTRGLIDGLTLAAMVAHCDALPAAAGGLAAGVVVDDPVWLGFVADERLVEAADACLGRRGVALFSSAYVSKPARHGLASALHQDGGGWPLDPVEAVTLWVALDHADAASGGLVVVTGSHRSGFHPHRPVADDVFGVAADVEPTVAPVALDLCAGDVSAHHPALLHGSGPNRSDRRRRALVVRYIPLDVRVTVTPWPSWIVVRR